MSFKNTLLPIANLLQSKGNLLDLSIPVVMGIINITPDSFYDYSRKQNLEEIKLQAEKMIADGAKILDIGGVSTRPGYKKVNEQEELDRIIPAIQYIKTHFPEIWISVDTYKSTVAKLAVEAGASIINDISSGSFDPDMIKKVADLNVPYIAMHLRGNEDTMHQNPSYKSVALEVLDELNITANRYKEAGIKDLIFDPGFGFSKTIEHNFELLNNLSLLRILGKPLLVGISRKSTIYKTLNIDPKEALNGTTALHMVALQQGANILRVHDVKEAIETITLFRHLGE